MAAPHTKAPRARLPRPERRQQLIDAAAAIAAKDGFHAVSIEAVAQRAGVTRAVIYQHFRDLQELLEGVVSREMTRARAQVSETALDDLSAGDPLDLMLTSLRAFLHAVQAHPLTWTLVLMPPEGAPRSLRKHIARGRDAVLAQLAAAIKPALAPDDDPADAELTARVLSAISDEYARLVLTDSRRYPPHRLVEHARRWLQQRPL
jgi:AcrR family transcriptional regulator